MFFKKRYRNYDHSIALEDLVRIRKTKEESHIQSIYDIWLLTDDEICKLRSLNTFLSAFELELKINIERMIADFKATCHLNNHLEFYTMEVTIAFLLDHKDLLAIKCL